MQLTPEFIRFCVVGVLNTVIDMGLLALLTRLAGFDPLIANVISFTTGAANSFLLNKYWTFGVGGRGREMATQATRFAVITILVFLIHEGMLFLLHTKLGWLDLLVKALAIGVGVVVGFVGNKWWTFRQARTT
jgi:putative flippase GtrA